MYKVHTIQQTTRTIPRCRVLSIQPCDDTVLVACTVFLKINFSFTSFTLRLKHSASFLSFLSMLFQFFLLAQRPRSSEASTRSDPCRVPIRVFRSSTFNDAETNKLERTQRGTEPRVRECIMKNRSFPDRWARPFLPVPPIRPSKMIFIYNYICARTCIIIHNYTIYLEFIEPLERTNVSMHRPIRPRCHRVFRNAS